MFRKVSVFIASSALTFLLTATIITSAVAITFTPAHVKSWLAKNNVYNTIVDDVLSQSKQVNTNSEAGGQNIQLDNPDIQKVIKQTVTPEFLQTNTEKIIDGTYPWLTGKSAQPTFQIDLSGIKTSLATNLANYARQRYSSLPVCTKANPVVSTDDVLNINCQVPGLNIEPVLQKQQNDIINSKDFLPNSVIDANTLTTNKNGQKQPLFEQLHGVPKAYQWARIAPFIFGLLSLGAIAVIIFLSTKRRKGLRRVGVTLFTTGALALLLIWGLSKGFEKASQEITKKADVNASGLHLQATVLSLFDTMRKAIDQPLLMFGIGFIVIAAIIFGYLILTRKSVPKPKEASAEEKTEPDTETEHKKEKSEK